VLALLYLEFRHYFWKILNFDFSKNFTWRWWGVVALLDFLMVFWQFLFADFFMNFLHAYFECIPSLGISFMIRVAQAVL